MWRKMFIDKDHSQYLLKGLSLLRQDEELCDIELIVGDAKVYGHKVVLAAVSDYFKAMFTCGLEERILQTVYLHDIDEKSLSSLVDFAYSGHITINKNNVEKLLIAANMLQVSKVVTASCEFLMGEIHCTNSVGFFEFAEKLALESLKQNCQNFIDEKFVEVSYSEDFLVADFNTMKLIISSNNINGNEEDVFSALERWVLFDEASRIKYFPSLYKNIRSFNLSKRTLTKLLKNRLVCKTNTFLQLEIQSVLKCKQNPFRLLDIDLRNSQPPRRCGDHIIVFGGRNSYVNPPLQSIIKYNINSDQWTECKCPSAAKPLSSAAYFSSDCYLTGGSIKSSSAVSCYSLTNDTWHSVREMNSKRNDHVTVCHEKRLFVMGGCDGNKSLKSCECYDPATDCWKSIADMNYSRSSFAGVSVEGYIYCLGGQSTCTVERYDNANRTWELMPAMSTRRSHFGAAEVCGFIYIVGGHDGKGYLRSMEKFDPVSSEWSIACPMPSARSGIGVTSLRHNIYVIGGHDGSRYLNSVYKYDVFEDTWTTVSSMPNARCYMAVTAFWKNDNIEDEKQKSKSL